MARIFKGKKHAEIAGIADKQHDCAAHFLWLKIRLLQQ
jgi:hypothetical protein